VALYAIAIGLLVNVFKPVVMGHPAFAELYGGANINVKILNWPSNTDVTVSGNVGTY
jgi:hypothetical protein